MSTIQKWICDRCDAKYEDADGVAGTVPDNWSTLYGSEGDYDSHLCKYCTESFHRWFHMQPESTIPLGKSDMVHQHSVASKKAALRDLMQHTPIWDQDHRENIKRDLKEENKVWMQVKQPTDLMGYTEPHIRRPKAERAEIDKEIKAMRKHLTEKSIKKATKKRRT